MAKIARTKDSTSAARAPFSVVLYECAMAKRVASVSVINYALVCLGVEGPGQLLEDRHEGVKIWGDRPPVFHLYPACISPYPWSYPAVSSLYLAILQHRSTVYPAAVYPAASSCQLYPYVSNCIQLCIFAVSRCISRRISHRLENGMCRPRIIPRWYN